MTGPIKIEFDMSQFNAALKKMDAAASGDTLGKAVMAGLQVIENYAKINAEAVFSGKARGELSGSIQSVLDKSSPTSAEGSVGPSVVYGRIQELGGIIKPVTAKMLSWIGDTGERIFAKLVHIPPRPYLRPAADEHMEEIKDAVTFQIKKGIGA